MVVTAHQPNFLPGLSVMRKLRRADVVIWLDRVAFTKNGWVNRNQLPDGTYLTVPVKRCKTGTPIDRMVIADGNRALGKIAETLRQRYRRAANYDDGFARIIEGFPAGALLVDLNRALLERLCQRAQVRADWSWQSQLTNGSKPPVAVSEQLAKLVEKAGGTVYLSGSSGIDYLEPGPFEERGIRVLYEPEPGPINPCALDVLFKDGGVIA